MSNFGSGRWGGVLMGLLAVATAGRAQWFQASNGHNPIAELVAPLRFEETRRTGLRLERAAFYQGYLHKAVTGGFGGSGNGSKLGYEAETGGELSLAARSSGATGSFALVYTPSYVARHRNPEWNSLNQTLRVEGITKLSPRSTFRLGAEAQRQEQEEISISPALYSAGGQLVAPGRASPFLRRMFAARLSASLSHTSSPRLTLRLGLEGDQSQTLTRRQDDGAGGRVFVPLAKSGRGAAGFDYRLSRQTSVGAEASGSRYASTLQDAWVARGVGRLRQELDANWSVTLRGGASHLSRLRAGLVLPSGTAAPKKVSWVAGGSLEYKGLGQTFSLSADRTAGDELGIGAQTNLSTSAAWAWRRPGSDWALHVGAGRYHMSIAGHPDFNTWQGRAGFARVLNRQTTLLGDYLYIAGSSGYTGLLNILSQRGPRLSLLWTPSPLTSP